MRVCGYVCVSVPVSECVCIIFAANILLWFGIWVCSLGNSLFHIFRRRLRRCIRSFLASLLLLLLLCIRAHSLFLCCAQCFPFQCSFHLSCSFRIVSLCFSFVLQLRAHVERGRHHLLWLQHQSFVFQSMHVHVSIIIASNRCGHRLVVADAVVCVRVFFVLQAISIAFRVLHG